MDNKQRSFSFRILPIGIASLILMALWIQFNEVLIRGGVIAENSPSTAAVGVFLGVMIVSLLLSRLSSRLKLGRAELIALYAMLIVSAPLMSQGLWHRFFGLTTAIPVSEQGFAMADSYSEKLWPHGEHLVENRRFENGLAPTTTEGVGSVSIEDMPASPIGAVKALKVYHANDLADDASTIIKVPLPRFKDEKEILVPGQTYYVAALVRLDTESTRTRVEISLHTDSGEQVQVARMQRATKETFTKPGGFVRTGQPFIVMPRDLNRDARIEIELTGTGTLYTTDIICFSSAALSRFSKGSSEIAAGNVDKLPANHRDNLVIRPDEMKSVDGVIYTMKGYVPWQQWARPLFYWSSIIIAIFLALLGLGVILRRQWVEVERFGFPLLAVPREILKQEQQGDKIIYPIFKKASFKVGIAIAFIYCLMHGFAHYIPGLPDPIVSVTLTSYFSNPAVKAFIAGMSDQPFKITIMFVAIAFFVDLDLLLSLVVVHWIAKIPYYFGEAYGWKTIPGPVSPFPFVNEQHIGAFLSLALLVVWTARRHLSAAGKTVLGLPGGVDDSGEAMRYRTATLLIIGAFAFYALWGWMTGLGWGSALIFFGFLTMCGVVVARIRTECGAPFTFITPYYPHLIFYLLGGLAVFGQQTIFLVFIAGGFMAVSSFLFFAPTQIEMIHLADSHGASKKGMSRILTFGFIAGAAISCYILLAWSCSRGTDSIPELKYWSEATWYFKSLFAARAEIDSAAAVTNSMTAPRIAVGTSASITLLLAFLRARFVGFWIHPLGYVLANSYFVYGAWGSLLVAWIVKWLAVKVGGPRIVRETFNPMFVGLFVGGVLGCAFWSIATLVGVAYGLRDPYLFLP